MTITIKCKEIEIDSDNDLQKILTNDAYEQEIENCSFESVTVTDDNGNQVFYSEDINDFTVEEDCGYVSYTNYDYVQMQLCDDYCTLDIDEEFDPKKLSFCKYKLILPDEEYDGITFQYINAEEDYSCEYEFDHGEEGIDYEAYYKKVEGEWIEFDPEDEEEEED